jgi:hypothetical protein
MISQLLIYLTIFLILFSLALVASAGDHAPDEAPKITREGTWCDNGSQTATTGECICSSHLGYHCAGGLAAGSAKEIDVSKSCQFGYGISFFHNSCLSCKCELSTEWRERKQAFRSNIKDQPLEGGKRGKRKQKAVPVESAGEESALVKETF